MPTLETQDTTKTCARPIVDVPDRSQILIVCDDSSMERLEHVLVRAGMMAQTVRSMTAACHHARTGRFQVILSKPSLADGSWRRLLDIAQHYDSGFEIVLLAENFDFADWAQALEAGAFDVVDTAWGLGRVAEIVKGALWAACLKAGGPRTTWPS